MKRNLISALLIGSFLMLLVVNGNSAISGYFNDDFGASSIPTFQKRWIVLNNSTANILVNQPTSDLAINNGIVISKPTFYQGILMMSVNASTNGAFFGYYSSPTCLGFFTIGGIVNFVVGNSTGGNCSTGTPVGSISVAFHTYTIRWFYNDTQNGLLQYVQPCVDGSCFPQFYSNSFFIPTIGIPVEFGGSGVMQVDWVAYGPNGVFTTATTSSLTSIASTTTSTTFTSSITTPITTTTGTYRTNTTTSVSTLTSASTTVTTPTTTITTTSSTTTSVSTSVSTSSSFTSITLLATATSTSTQSVTEAPWSQYLFATALIGGVLVIALALITKFMRGGKPPQATIEQPQFKIESDETSQ